MASGLLPALLVSAWAVGALGAPGGAAANATFTVLNLDGPDEGLNDPTPFPGALGNPAMTLGEARRNVLDAAADFWGGLLASAVSIRVAARFNPLGGGSSSATLGLGTPSLLANYAGAPFTETWIPSALADKLAGVDKDPGDDDLEIELNSDVDGPVVLGSSVFYYGLDGNPPGDDVDLFTVVLHEIAHGLGFSSAVSELTGSKPLGFDDLFSAELECPAGAFLALSDPQRVVCGSSGTDLHWSGASARGPALRMWLCATSFPQPKRNPRHCGWVGQSMMSSERPGNSRWLHRSFRDKVNAPCTLTHLPFRAPWHRPWTARWC